MSRRRSSASASARSKQRAVRQAGQRVVVGLVVEALGVVLAGGDVDALGDVVVRAGRRRRGSASGAREPAEAAVGADVAAARPRARRTRAASSPRARRGRRRARSPRSTGLGRRAPVRSRSSSLPCSTRAVGARRAPSRTGASSNARRKRSSELAVAARPRSLARQEIRLATASAATKRPWMPAQRHASCVVVEDRVGRAARPSRRAGARRTPIASRYAHHSS